jgi:hypothetical protein
VTSALKLIFDSGIVVRCTRYIFYVINFVNDLQQVDDIFLCVFLLPPSIRLTLRYDWYIVENGVKYQQFITYMHIINCFICLSKRSGDICTCSFYPFLFVLLPPIIISFSFPLNISCRFSNTVELYIDSFVACYYTKQ